MNNFQEQKYSDKKRSAFYADSNQDMLVFYDGALNVQNCYSKL